MKRFVRCTVVAAVAAFAVLVWSTASFAAPAANLGFENDVTGWSGLGKAVTSYAPNYPTAASGKMMLQLVAGCTKRVMQQAGITLEAGHTISGLAAFQALDYMPFDDSGTVVINDGATDTTVYSKAVHDVGDFGHSTFAKWSFTNSTPAAQTISVSYIASNFTDCTGNSVLLGDAVITTTACAPILPGLALSCTLRDAGTGLGLPGETIHFSGGATAVTDSNGVATDANPLDIVGALSGLGYTGSFYGSANGNESSGVATIV